MKSERHGLCLQDRCAPAEPRGGSIGMIAGQRAEKLRARIDAGATARHEVCTSRDREIQCIAKQRGGGRGDLAQRPLSRVSAWAPPDWPRLPSTRSRTLTPRSASRTRPPLCVRVVRGAASVRRLHVRDYFRDEAWFGQQETTTGKRVPTHGSNSHSRCSVPPARVRISRTRTRGDPHQNPRRSAECVPLQRARVRHESQLH